MPRLKLLANVLSLSRAISGVALAVIAAIVHPEPIAARWMIVVFLTIQSTDLVDGRLARRSGRPQTPWLDATGDGLHLLGLAVGTVLLGVPGWGIGAVGVLALVYGTSQGAKRWLNQQQIDLVNRSHKYGSMLLGLVVAGWLVYTANLW